MICGVVVPSNITLLCVFNAHYLVMFTALCTELASLWGVYLACAMVRGSRHCIADFVVWSGVGLAGIIVWDSLVVVPS